LPYIETRTQGAGYAVSIAKAGAALVGHGAGSVRPPLSDLKPQQREQLKLLIDRLGAQ
ncbi:MAG TPA: 5-dehydro-4-deoxyglucarate dehydratase, partial [Ottowia sp.]|nr:5-dehydro-4-deoxyglucarate dehydratase [Ottowia sp.]